MGFFKIDQYCPYHLGGSRHNIKQKIQDLIDQKFIILQRATPNINKSHFSNHDGVIINMIEEYEGSCVCKSFIKVILNTLE